MDDFGLPTFGRANEIVFASFEAYSRTVKHPPEFSLCALVFFLSLSLDMLLRVIENIFLGAQRWMLFFLQPRDAHYGALESTVQCPCQPINVKRRISNDVTNLNNIPRWSLRVIKSLEEIQFGY